MTTNTATKISPNVALNATSIAAIGGKAAFVSAAKYFTVTGIGGTPLVALPRAFSEGGVGWGTSDKVTLMVDGHPVACQVSLNISVIGSKTL